MTTGLEVIGGPLDGTIREPAGLGLGESFMVRGDLESEVFHYYRRNGMRWEYYGTVQKEGYDDTK